MNITNNTSFPCSWIPTLSSLFEICFFERVSVWTAIWRSNVWQESAQPRRHVRNANARMNIHIPPSLGHNSNRSVSNSLQLIPLFNCLLASRRQRTSKLALINSQFKAYIGYWIIYRFYLAITRWWGEDHYMVTILVCLDNSVDDKYIEMHLKYSLS